MTRPVRPDSVLKLRRHWRSYRAFPISTKSGRVAGVLLCDFPHDTIPPHHIALIQVFVRQLGLAFSNIFAFERLMQSYRKNLHTQEATVDEANMPSVKFTLRISPNQDKKLDSLANEHGITKAEILRDLLTEKIQ